MNFSEYQEHAKTTAIYPVEQSLIYPALGLAEEAGEVSGQVKRMIRDDGGKITPDRAAKLTGEIGDTLYYLAALCTDLGISLEVVAKQNIAKLADRKARGVLKGEGSNR